VRESHGCTSREDQLLRKSRRELDANETPKVKVRSSISSKRPKVFPGRNFEKQEKLAIRRWQNETRKRPVFPPLQTLFSSRGTTIFSRASCGVSAGERKQGRLIINRMRRRTCERPVSINNRAKNTEYIIHGIHIQRRRNQFTVRRSLAAGTASRQAIN